MNVGEKLRYVRTLRGMSITDLHEQSGLSISYLSDAETGRSQMSLKSLNRVSKVLKVSSSYLLDERASTLPQIAEIKGYDLPDEIKDFVSSADNLPYVILAKKAFENGVSADTLSKLVDIYRKEMDKS